MSLLHWLLVESSSELVSIMVDWGEPTAAATPALGTHSAIAWLGEAIRAIATEAKRAKEELLSV